MDVTAESGQDSAPTPDKKTAHKSITIIYYGGLEVAGSDGSGGLLGQKRVKGGAGDSLTVTGTNLDGATVTIAGQTATPDPGARNAASSLTVTVPPETSAAGASVGVTVTNTWGTATAADAFTYLTAPAVPLLTLNAEFRIGDLTEGAKASVWATRFAVGQPVTVVVHSTPTPRRHCTSPAAYCLLACSPVCSCSSHVGDAKPGNHTVTKAPQHRFCGGAFAHPGACAGTLHTLGPAVVL